MGMPGQPGDQGLPGPDGAKGNDFQENYSYLSGQSGLYLAFELTQIGDQDYDVNEQRFSENSMRNLLVTSIRGPK